ncbi:MULTISPECIES: HAD family hydrolase [Corynebacterium]|uniref:HAD family hydrolase n=1 Tax=Corynebacterium TaxID=1716 RepID=UPI0021A3D116|nr:MULTISPECIES: HAD family hydrolase [Corynebacterium]MCT1428770.1 HAD family hydrolase [Corynebacterium sp. p3-SID1241]
MSDAEALAAYDGYLSAYRQQWRAFADVHLIPTVDLGCPKPQRDAYLAACDQLGTVPADTLMVGDSLTNDVQGARKAGLYALHLDRAGDGDLSSLSALKEVLPQIAS